MPKVTRADLLSADPGEGVPLIEALAPLATGLNEDGTPFSPDPADQTSVGNIGATNAAVTQAVTEGMASWSVATQAVATNLTLQFEVSYDGGTTWFATQMSDVGAGGAPASSVANPNGKSFEGAVPGGGTHVRARASAYTSGNPSVRVSVSPAEYEPVVSVSGGSISISNNPAIGKTASATGCLIYRNLSTGAAAVIKGSAGQLYAIQITNLGAAARHIKLYNKATAPVVGTDTPVMTLSVPAGQTLSFAAAADIGAQFPTGLGVAATTGVLDTDVTLAGANEVVVNALYA